MEIWSDQAILKRRSLIERVINQFKNLCQIDHTRHRSPINFTVNLLAGIVAYCLMPNKPLFRWEPSLASIMQRGLSKTEVGLPSLPTLIYGSGMRLREGLPLHIKDMNFDQQVIVVVTAKMANIAG